MTRAPLVEPGPELSPAEVERYARHLLLPGIGSLGQRRLRNARVCVIGAGGLGSPVLQYLAAAGVGTLGIVDDDTVSLSNLQRQVLHGVDDVGRAKVESAAATLAALAPEVRVVTHEVRLTAQTVDLIGGYDLVVDGSDNFATRYLVNDACVRLGLPEVWGSVLRFDAQVSVFWGRPPRGVPAVQLRDLFPAPPPPDAVPSCAEAGVLGALCGQVGTVMATEAIKLITGAGRSLLGRVLVLDALDQRWTEIALTPQRPPGEGRGSTAEPVIAASPDPSSDVPTVSAGELAVLLAGEAPPVVIDVREAGEREHLPGPRALPLDLSAALAGELPVGTAVTGRVVVVCRSGVRSLLAAQALRAAGHDAAHLAGGVQAWADLRAGADSSRGVGA